MRNLLRKIIGRMANLTPNVVYFAKGWPVKINGVLRIVAASKGGSQTPMTTTAVAI